MAATVTLLGSTFNTTSGTHTVTATPAVGDLIVIIRANTGNATSTAPTDNNSSGTYTKITPALKASSVDLMEMYVRTALVGSATSTVFSDAAGTTTGGGLAVYKITGMSTAGLSAIRQSAAQANQASGGTPTPVFSATTLSTNPIIGAVFNATSAATLTPRTNFTEDVDVGYSTPTTGFESMHRNSGETSTSLAWGSTSGSAFCSIAVEFQFNTAPTTALNAPADTGTVASTTPQLTFTGTDADSDAITYEVQIDTVNTFDSISTTPAFVQSATPGTNASGGTNTTVAGAFASTNTLHNAIIVGAIADNTSSVTSVTDTAGNIYTLEFKYPAAGNRYIEIWACFDIKAQASNVVTYNQGFNDGAVFAHEYSGLAGTADQTGSGTSTNALPTATTGVTTSAKQLVFSILEMDIFSSNSIDSVGTGYSNFQSASSSFVLGAVESKIISATGAQTATFNVTNAGGGSWRLLAATFPGASSPPQDKLSNTDTGFTDITNGAHVDPFTSGEQIGYTVQGGSALTNGVTYYWRVRGKDPSGTNTYGAWATTRSFTVSTGGSASITQVAATLTATGGTQSIATVNNAAISQSHATITATGGTQAVSTVVIASASITQLAAAVTATGGTQTVSTVQNTSIAQAHAALTVTGGTQTAVGTIVVSVAVTQVGATITATGGTQSVSANSSIAQSAATVTATGGVQTVATVNIVSISQVAASITATGGTQTVATIRNVQIAQLAGTLTITGGTQTVVINATTTQVAANLTVTGGTQAIATQRFVNLSQVAANLTASGGVQTITVLRVVSIAQSAATLTATGGTQAVLAARLINITQTHATLTAMGGTQTLAVVVNAAVTQVAAQLTVTGGSNLVTLVFIPFDTLTITSVEDTLTIRSYEDNIRIINMQEDTITVTSVEDDLRITSVEDNIVVRA